MNVKLLMVNVVVIQTVTYIRIAVKMSTVLQVLAIAMPSLIAGSCDYVIHFRAQDVCRCGNHILLQ